MVRSKKQAPDGDRRTEPRTSKEHRATGIVQALIQDPGRAAKMLARDLAAGGDPSVIYGLLDAAESIVQLRGIDLSPQVRALRKALDRKLGRESPD